MTTSGAPGDRPNIIFILSDQHNPEVLGHDGDPHVRTPNIDGLFAGGASMDNCYCPAPLCVPSRSGMLTGMLPCHTGVYNNMQMLRSDQPTFVNALTVGGYETVLSGRMHFVGWDQRHGFEKRFVGDMTPSHIGADNEYGIYGEFKRSSGQNLTSINKSGPGNSAVLDFDRVVTDAACDYIRTRRDRRPLFMTVGFYGPHCPYIGPPDLFEYYYRLLPEMEPVTEGYRAGLHPAIREWHANRNLETVDPAVVRRIRAAYYAMVEYVDGLVGEIVSCAGSCLDLNNTLIVYGSDHGDNIGRHGLFWKTNMYDGSSRVPLGFSWKGRIPPGVRQKRVSSLLDIAPTLLSIAGCPGLPVCDGVDIAEYLFTGREFEAGRVVVSECSDIKGDKPSAMARDDRYKLVVHAGHEAVQLFDMEADRLEVNDLGRNPGYAERIAGLREHLYRFWTPEKARADLDVALKNFGIMRNWVEIVKPDPVDEWFGDNKNNYLLPMPDVKSLSE